MDKESRAKLLRERPRAVFGPFASVRSDAPKRRPRTASGKPFHFVYPMGFAGGPGFPVQWVHEPDPPQKAPKVRPRRIARKSPLWAIEEKWDSRPNMRKRCLSGQPAIKFHHEP